jgi:hypothetical protein
MRPHTILENMADIDRRLTKPDEQLETTLWGFARRCLKEAVTFEFNDLAPTPEHADFGSEMAQRGLLRQPFPATFYSWRCSGKCSAVLACNPQLVNPGSDSQHAVMITMTEARGANGGFWLLPSFAMFLDRDNPMDSPVPWRSIIKGPRTSRDGTELTEAESLDRMGRGLRFVLGAASMLIAKDVAQRVEPAPERLNAQRAKKGRPPINEVRTISILAGGAQRYADAGREFASHASPKMHWRRGHFRTLNRGEEDQRVIPVAPSLVGAKDEARHIVPKEYVVSSGPAE